MQKWARGDLPPLPPGILDKEKSSLNRMHNWVLFRCGSGYLDLFQGYDPVAWNP